MINELIRKFTNLNEMYEIYIDRILLPIAPNKIEIKSNNMNKTYDLVNGSQFNFLKDDGLKVISFDAIIPNSKYPFSLYKNNIFKSAKEFIDELTELKEKKKPFMLKIIRHSPYDDNIRVSFENFNINENSDEGRDLIVRLTFKEYKDLMVKEIIPINKNNTININNIAGVSKSNLNNPGTTDYNDNLAIITIKRPLSNNIDLSKKTNKLNAKNLVLTSRKYTSTPDKVIDIKKAANISSNLELLPKTSWW